MIKLELENIDFVIFTEILEFKSFAVDIELLFGQGFAPISKADLVETI